MIKIYCEGEKVAVDMSLKIGYFITLTYARHTDMDATLLRNQLQKDFGDMIEKIRRDAYNEGWKDKAGKKFKKQTWFSRNP